MNYRDYLPEKIDRRTAMKPMNGQYSTKCANCGNPMYAYAKDKLGTLPTVFCSRACETNSKYDRKWKK
jgi:hypothetical protein